MLGVQDEIIGTGGDRWSVHFLDRLRCDTASLSYEIRVFDNLVAGPEVRRCITPRGEQLVLARRRRELPVDSQ